MKYVQKEAIFEAIQYTGHNGSEIRSWSEDKVIESPVLEPTNDNPTGDYLQIKRHDVVMTARVGDYIVKSTHGHFYPIHPSGFDASHVPVFVNGHNRLSIDHMQRQVHENAVQHGWWDNEYPFDASTTAAKIALIHSELSEALEAIRNGNPQDEHCPEFKSLDIELADAVIRIMDLAEARNIDLAAAIEAKHAYNTTRPHRHGGKVC